MKKLILLLVVFFATTGFAFSSSEKSPHNLQFTVSFYKNYIDKYIFIKVNNEEIEYQGKCVAIDSIGITILETSTGNIRVLTVPMARIKYFYKREK